MPRNGSGTYTLPAGNPVVTGTTISSTVQNNTTSDIATALTNSIAKDGQTTPTANLPMGTYRHTGVGNGVAATDYTALGQAQSSAYQLIGTIAGVDTITGVLTPTLTAYAAGQKFSFISAGANTGAVTIDIDGLGAKSVTKLGTTALAAGDIPSGAIVEIEYDGTRFQLCNLVAITSLSSVTGTLAIANGGTGQTTALAAFDALKQAATDSYAGTQENATNAETLAFSSTTRTVTPANLGSVMGLVKLNSGTVSAAASLDIVLTSYIAQFTNFKVVVTDIAPATDIVAWYGRVSTNGGSSYDSGANNYGYIIIGGNTSAASLYQGQGAATQMQFSPAAIGNLSTEGIRRFEADISNVNDAAGYCDFSYKTSFVDNTGAISYVTGNCMRAAAQDTDAFQFYFSSGNITAANWVLYGWN